jgi:peptidyl-prolyl cis-trans isomerase SurA
MIYLKSLTAPHIANLKEDYSRIQIEAEAVKKQKTVDSWVKKQLKTTYLRINQGYISCPDLKTWENQN